MLYYNRLASKCLFVLICIATLLVTGCDDPEIGEAGEDTAGEVMAGEVMAGEVMAGEVMAGEIAIPFDGNEYGGVWDMKVRLVDVGSIEVDFRMEIQASARSLDQVDLRILLDGEVSDIVATINDTMIEDDGSFQLVISEAAIPAMFSPTGSEVVVSFTLDGRPNTNGFCGDVTGEVITLALPISVSTFGAIETGMGTQIPGSCDDSNLGMMLPRIETCPTLQAGMNTINSGGYERFFEVILPTQYTEEAQWPLITLWHGFGSSQEEIKEYSEMETLAESEGFILVVPTSYPEGAVEWDSLAAVDSPDLAFFDDMTGCLFESFSIDPDQLFVTGFSGGGLWTAYLSVFRADVIASAVGMSSGLIPDYPQDVSTAIPYLAAWGGEADIAYDQDFDLLARDLLEDFTNNGHFVVSCNHGLEHVWNTDFTPWIVRFLLDHPRGIGELPYAAGLPEGVYPDYCEIVSAD